MSFLNSLFNNSNETYTENGAKAFASTGSDCLDLFFAAGALRSAGEDKICALVTRAYAEDPAKTMKIVFFARDVRGGLGERRFFRIAMRCLAETAPKSVELNIPNIAEYGRYDDLCVLLDTPCARAAAKEIKERLDADVRSMNEGKPVSLLAKWLPSVNASSADTRLLAKKLCKLLGIDEPVYRKTLSALRKYLDILENRLRETDYSFDYSKQPSGAMFKYRKAFIRNDNERYLSFLHSVEKGEAKMKAGVLYPYEVVRRCISGNISDEERKSLDVTWNSLADYGNSAENDNAIAVIDGSGSMTCGGGSLRPIDAALSLGLYFAERNKGAFANHFITFSERPRLIRVKGADITEKARYCSSYNECANTDLEAVFNLILNTAVRDKVPAEELPKRLYIISDMEFDYCIEGGNDKILFDAMSEKYACSGYKLPEIVFWNVNSRNSHLPVTMSRTGAALVSGNSPAIFDMVRSGDISPVKIMEDIIGSERYNAICA